MHAEDLTACDEPVSLDGVVEIAIGQFSEQGFQDTRLDTIAKMSGMSKRMIHYHFGDKKGLYLRCLTDAACRLQPPAEELVSDTLVPVEGVRQVVDAVYLAMVRHPESLRLLQHECLHRVLNLTSVATLVTGTQVSLQLDKLLMQGQDSGAFRPGISAEDIFFLIASLAFARAINRDLMINLLDVDTCSALNTDGIHRMAVDTVLAFLTANIPDEGHDSYLTVDRIDEDSQSGLDVYGNLDSDASESE